MIKGSLIKGFVPPRNVLGKGAAKLIWEPLPPEPEEESDWRCMNCDANLDSEDDFRGDRCVYCE